MDYDFRIYRKHRDQMTCVILPAVFFLFFCLVYNPFQILGYYGFGGFKPAVHIVMLSCIIIVSELLSRGAVTYVIRNKTYKWWNGIIWCLLEIFIIACFFGLYTSLFRKVAFFSILKDCLKFSFLTLIYPYVILALVEVLRNKRSDLDFKGASDTEGLMKFYDEHKRLKLTIDKNDILSIAAEFNYININYLEGDKIKTFLLRNSMKSQEENASNHGMVRCHRSYYVNPSHVKMLSKEKGGLISAVLDTKEPFTVPVSKQYYAALASML